MTRDPIVAICTAQGVGAVGIVRLSGMGLADFVTQLCRRSLVPRHATLIPIIDNKNQTIDEVLALWFPSPHSYTGEDVLELQGHGGPVVLHWLLEHCLALGALGALPQLRLAQPGEFTERAFLNDKLDLMQAEAVMDLIQASSRAAVRSAQRTLSGEFQHWVQSIQHALTQLRALVESTLDFPEEDLDFLHQDDAFTRWDELLTSFNQLLAQAKQGVVLRQGFKLVIAGQPNAGKSSLLNALSGDDIAIVSAIAGTTRDVVQQTITLEGIPFHILDTAGLRSEHLADEIEIIGMNRAWQHIGNADAVLLLHDVTQWNNPIIQQADQHIAAQCPKDIPLIHVWNKVDEYQHQYQHEKINETINETIDKTIHQEKYFLISAKTHQGLNDLKTYLLDLAGYQHHHESPILARERHLQALYATQSVLQSAAQHFAHRPIALELLAEDLSQAQIHLGTITGEITADDLLGTIFGQFCIGK